MFINSIESLIDVLKHNKVSVFGTGMIASKFYTCLKLKGMTDSIDSFCVTQKRQDFFCNKVIKNIEELEQHTIVFIAVHETSARQIENLLNERYIYNIWIEPYLIELLWGKPIAENATIEMKNIIQNSNNYMISVRSLTIDQYFNQNDFGYNLYIKANKLFSTEETAFRRLEAFIGLIKSWEKNEFIGNNNIKVDANYQIIDGTHRISVADYFNAQHIKGNVYPVNQYYEEWAGMTLLKPEMFCADIFSDRELYEIKQRFIQLKKKYSE